MLSPAVFSSEDSQDSMPYSPNQTTMNPTSTDGERPQAPTERNHEPHSRSSTPDAPPYSPLTPTLSNATLPDIPNLSHLSPSSRSSKRPLQRESRSQPQPQRPQPRTRPAPETISSPPPAVPISEDTNPDAIAVRAALDVLQIQRKRALEDIHTLRRQKDVALLDPQRFAERLLSGDVREDGDGRDVAALRIPALDGAESDGERYAEEEFGDGGASRRGPEVLPGAQEVVRCPPVNWGKYHVAEGVLDRLHEEQRRRPGKGGVEGPEHVVMAPYRPFVDAKEQDLATVKASNQRKR